MRLDLVPGERNRSGGGRCQVNAAAAAAATHTPLPLLPHTGVPAACPFHYFASFGGVGGVRSVLVGWRWAETSMPSLAR